VQPIQFTDHKHGVDVGVNDIKLDLSVQRAVMPARVRKLVANFDPILLGELLISERADGLYILDGHHRLNVAKQVGQPSVTCEVFTGMPRADEARLFLGRNDRANIAQEARDRNLATSGDQATLDVQMAAQSAGFVFIAERVEDSTFRDRAAGVAIMVDAERRKHVETTGPEHLARVLGFYARVYGNQERPESLLLRAVSKIYLGQPEVDENRLFEKLRGLPPQQIVATAAARRAEVSIIRSLSNTKAAVEIIAEQYNRGLPADSARRIRP
jgi:hypothetical protein